MIVLPMGRPKPSASFTVPSPKFSVDGMDIDANVWLPTAAEYYGLSKNIKDYLLVPVPTHITDIPNTNGDSLSLKEMMLWNANQGRMAYKTWEGRPMFVEHQHQMEWVRGLILHTYIVPVKRFAGFYKLVMLGALDRTRDPERCKKVEDNVLNTFSMGMAYDSYECSICHKISTGGMTPHGTRDVCGHTAPGEPLRKYHDGRLAYRMNRNITGFELSLLENRTPRAASVHGYSSGYGDPSCVAAIANEVLDPMKLFQR